MLVVLVLVSSKEHQEGNEQSTAPDAYLVLFLFFQLQKSFLSDEHMLKATVCYIQCAKPIWLTECLPFVKGYASP